MDDGGVVNVIIDNVYYLQRLLSLFFFILFFSPQGLLPFSIFKDYQRF
jgi:hypothetical protein